MSCDVKHVRQAMTKQAFRTLNSVVVPAVQAGIGSPPPVGLGLVVLETTGRVSGMPRRAPLVALRIGNRVKVSTVRSSSQWLKNLEANESASVWVAGRKRGATGTVDAGPFSTAALALT